MNFFGNRLRTVCLLAGLALLTASAWGQAPFYLHDGDCVVFYGDSITEQRLYTTDVELYTLTRFPQMRVAFVNAGVGGDRVTGGWAGAIDVRLQRDVLAYHPTVVTIMLGMNDGEYKPWDQHTFDVYANGYRHIVDRLTGASPNLRLTLIRPSPFDDVTRRPEFPGGYNGVLLRYADFVRQVAAQHGFTLADMNTPVVDALEKANALNPVAAKLIIPDRVHPSEVGHWVMALALLKSWNAPSLVTNVELDATSAEVNHADNTAVSDVARTSAGLTWTQLDKALPLPLTIGNGNIELTNKLCDLYRQLDQERLRVNGLAPGRYELRIDKQKVGEFSEAGLGQGINLAEHSTPMQEQAFEVLMQAERHNSLHWERLPVFTAKPPLKDEKAALEFISQMEQREQEAEREAAQPKARNYELTRVGAAGDVR